MCVNLWLTRRPLLCPAGNLQKFVVGREIIKQPRVLIVAQPTWGVDVGAATFIRQAMIELAASGSAVIVISQDLEEIFAISNRISVLSEGRLSAPQPAADMSAQTVGLLMGGVRKSGAAAQPAGERSDMVITAVPTSGSGLCHAGRACGFCLGDPGRGRADFCAAWLCASACLI